MTNPTNTPQDAVERVELLPCPFCGCDVIRQFHPFERRGYVIDCNRCNGGFHEMDEDRARKAWNTRSLTKPDEEMGWQPIETAPQGRDATGQLGICVATPEGDRWKFNHAWFDDAVEEWTDIRSDRYLSPTHWRPLPSEHPRIKAITLDLYDGES